MSLTPEMDTAIIQHGRPIQNSRAFPWIKFLGFELILHTLILAENIISYKNENENGNGNEKWQWKWQWK